MTDRILDFSQSSGFLRISLEQLVIKLDGQPEEIRVPISDIAAVVLAHPQISLTASVVSSLCEAGAPVVFCNRKMSPVGMTLPLDVHSLQQKRMAAQSVLPQSTKKRLWRQLVAAKIRAQAAVLEETSGSDSGLYAMAGTVKAGDSANAEARAARVYWPRLFNDPTFRRRPEGEGANILLNYGYAVLRAQVARAICAAGLHPSLGLHHSNQYDTFCLADDLMEPFRPLLDRRVASVIRENPNADIRDKAVKGELLSCLVARYSSDGESRTLPDWLSRLTASLAAVIERKSATLGLPSLHAPHARKGPISVQGHVAHRDVRSAG